MTRSDVHFNKITLDDVESELERGKNEGSVARYGPLDLVLAKGNGDLDLGVTTQVERNGCVPYVLNVELSGLGIAWLWSIREREELRIAPRFFL